MRRCLFCAMARSLQKSAFLPLNLLLLSVILLLVAWSEVSKCNLEILLFMLVLVRKIRKRIAGALLLGATAAFVSCASQKQVAVVDDPDSKQESIAPWIYKKN